jgi:hypothetical protein
MGLMPGAPGLSVFARPGNGTPIKRQKENATTLPSNGIWGRLDYAAGGRILITRISVSLIRTGPSSPKQYHRKLL